MRPLAELPCLTLHIFLADFIPPLFFLVRKLDSMFLGLSQPLHWAALEKESEKTPYKRQI